MINKIYNSVIIYSLVFSLISFLVFSFELQVFFNWARLLLAISLLAIAFIMFLIKRHKWKNNKL